MSPSLTNALRTATILIVFTALGTGLLAYTFNLTKGNIAASEAQAQRELIAQALPRNLYDNDVVRDVVQLAPTPDLGTTQPSIAYRARLGDTPSALVMEAIAPDGYSGKIKLLVAIQVNGEIAGVRVVAHNETPGLGDYIERAKSAWIEQFDHATLGANDAPWKVKKDGGRFDYVSGATITPRAVIKAVHKALRYYEQHGHEIFARPALQQEQP